MAKLRSDEILVAFTDHYKSRCFAAWYASGRPPHTTIIHGVIPKDEYDRKPTEATLRQWRTELAWDARADELDARAESAVEDELVNARILMLKEQAAKGRELQVMGMEYLRENDFDTSASAVSAIFKGASLERTSRGLSEHLVSMMKMDNDQLVMEVQKLIDKANDSGEVIDVGEIAPEEDDDEVDEDA